MVKFELYPAPGIAAILQGRLRALYADRTGALEATLVYLGEATGMRNFVAASATGKESLCVKTAK